MQILSGETHFHPKLSYFLKYISSQVFSQMELQEDEQLIIKNH